MKELTDSTTGKTGKQYQRRKSSVDLGTMVYGKVPPQAKDLEEAILGAIMLEKTAIDFALEILQPECFYVEAHQRIFRAMLSLTNKSQPIDILTVTQELRACDELEMCGGAYYITRLTNSVVSAANIESHSRIILQMFIKREIIRIGGEMIGNAYEDSTDVFDLLDSVEQGLFAVTNNMNRKGFLQADYLLVKAIQEIEYIRQHQQQLSGVPSGFHSIDKITHGWQKTDLIIVAARPGVGKTAFALNIALNAVTDPNKPTGVGFFSLEMSSGQLMKRLLACQTELPLYDILRGRLDETGMRTLYARGIQKLAQVPLFIDDQGSLNIFELRAKARRLKAKHNIGLIIIDYLQLMSGPVDSKKGRNREQEISEISRNLKLLAKELEIPIIALSQLSRAVETRGGEKIPQLSDLRESGAIEQDADVVGFIYRPEYYGLQKDGLGESTAGESHIRFAKNRNGSLETVHLTANLRIQKFFEKEAVFNKLTEGVPSVYVQTGSKMNNDIPDPNDDLPF